MANVIRENRFKTITSESFTLADGFLFCSILVDSGTATITNSKNEIVTINKDGGFTYPYYAIGNKGITITAIAGTTKITYYV